MPVKVEEVAQHRMHSEWGQLDDATADFINAARDQGGRVVWGKRPPQKLRKYQVSRRFPTTLYRWRLALAPREAASLYARFVDRLSARGLNVKQGVFQAMMEVELVNGRSVAGVILGIETDAAEPIPVRLHLGPQVVEVDVPLLVTAYEHDPVAHHDGARGVGSMGRGRDQYDIPVLFPPVCVISPDHHQAFHS